MRLLLAFLAAALAFAQNKTVLAIGAHAGDMEVTSGAVLAREARLGSKVVLLHLTAGEGGHPRKSAAEYGEQKRKEAAEAAKVLGAQVKFGPFLDGQLRDTQEAEEFVARIIREVKPTNILTHWKNSIHPDHAATYEIVDRATILASVPGFESQQPPHKGLRTVWFTENWEDAEGYRPYVYVDVTEDMETWRKATAAYEFLRGGVSSFPYMQWYEGQAMVRGAESRKGRAVSFATSPMGQKRILDALP